MYLLLVEQPPCDCKAVIQEQQKIPQAIEAENGEHVRYRRQAATSNNLYQLQTQIMMIETR